MERAMQKSWNHEGKCSALKFPFYLFLFDYILFTWVHMYHYQSFRVQHCHLACSKEQLNISHSGKVYLLPGCVRPAMHAACYSSVVLLFPLQLYIAVAEQCSSATAMFIPTVICECPALSSDGLHWDEIRWSWSKQAAASTLAGHNDPVYSCFSVSPGKRWAITCCKSHYCSKGRSVASLLTGFLIGFGSFYVIVFAYISLYRNVLSIYYHSKVIGRNTTVCILQWGQELSDQQMAHYFFIIKIMCVPFNISLFQLSNNTTFFLALINFYIDDPPWKNRIHAVIGFRTGPSRHWWWWRWMRLDGALAEVSKVEIGRRLLNGKGFWKGEWLTATTETRWSD